MKRRSSFWPVARIWAAALFFGGIAYYQANSGKVADAIFLVAFVLLLTAGYAELSVKELWRIKRDKTRAEIEDDDA